MTARLRIVSGLLLLASLALAAPAAAQLKEPPIAGTLRACDPASGPPPPTSPDPRGTVRGSANPLAGLSFFVDPTYPAYEDLKAYRRRGDHASADLIARLALQPKGRWFGRFTRPNMQKKVREYLNCVQWLQPGSVPIMVVMRHQGAQCNPRYTAGGAAEDARTRRWYREFAEAVGSARVVIAFEPDSIGTISCLKRSRQPARKRLLRYGVNVLSKLPNATVYLEGTASDWKSPRFTARLLKYMGIRKVRGFMLNVTHYDWTSNNIRYGRRVSRLVGGKPFVVSTSYNGRGPVHYRTRIAGRIRRINVFCNPRFRGLGPKPTTGTGFAKVDAFLWLNRPGVSGAGGCNGAPAVAGTWWPQRALMFARYATDWVRPPRGTRQGLFERVSLCRLGAPLRPGRYSTVAPERRCKR